MNAKKILWEIRENIGLVLKKDSPLGKSLWEALLEVHPADLALFFADINKEHFRQLFGKLPKELKIAVFQELSESMKVFILAHMREADKVDALDSLPIDELTDLFDHFSDKELEKYLNLLHKKAREKVLSLLQFDPESAGGIMDTRVLTFMEDYTVEKSIKILQRLRPSRDIYQQIYITNETHRLVGYIKLEDLVLQPPKSRISSFMRKNEFVALAHKDREVIAKKMVHYGLMSIPVVDKNNHFLGAIPSDVLVDVIVEEASEDVQKMSALAPMKYPYFETSFFRLLFERSYILVALLLAESFSGTILKSFEDTLPSFLFFFIPMLISAGGNTSSQTSAVVIQGMAAGDIRSSNIKRFLRREFLMAAMLALILGLVGFARIYYSSGVFMQSITVSLALAIIVMLSVVLGSGIPLLLKKMNIDPAFSAGPFLATLMDILGILIYCYLAKLILF